MKYPTKTSMLVFAALAAVLPVLVAVQLVGASGTASLYLSPSSNTVAPGDTIDIAIHEDSGSNPTNGVQANLSYSAGSLSFVGITDSPDFGVDAQCSSGNLSSCGSGGTLSIARGTCGGCAPVTGDKIVATAHFKANSSGTATVSFGAGSTVVSSIDHLSMTLTTSGGTYSITSPATMSLSPATKTLSQGGSFDVDIYEDSGTDGVNGVQANLSYPSNLLTFTGATNSSAWPLEAQSSASGGVVKIGRGISAGSAPLTGRQLVATIKFNAVGSGNALLDFTSGTGLIRASDNSVEPTNNTGGSYAITAAPASGGGGSATPPKTSPPPKSVTSSVSKPVSPGGPAVSAPVTAPVDNQGPAITGITVTNLSVNSATINWTTSEPATSEVDYGLSTKFILSTGDSALATSHSIKLDSKELVAHKKYHFIVKSADAAGNQTVSKDMTFSTGGIQITTTEIAIAAGAAVLGGGAWLAAAGGLKLGGGMAASAGGIYIEPKPIIVGGGAPPPPPVVQPQSAAPAALAQTTAKTPAAQPPPTPGKIVGPKSAPAPDADGQTLPKWVKK